MIMRKSLLIILLLKFALVVKLAHGTALCPEFFAASSAKEDRDGTDDLIAYLGNLLEERIIGEEELRRFVQGLEAGELTNPISVERSWTNSASLLHRTEIQEYLDSTDIEQAKILSWARRMVNEKTRLEVEREKASEATKDLSKMDFMPLPPGKFKMGERGKTVPVELTRKIEMMSTLVTQAQWIEMMGENPSHFTRAFLNQDTSQHPVENITWWSAIVFANEVSKKHGLKPAYNLDAMKLKGSPQNGSLEAEGKLTINAADGNIYLAEGFRLPTEAEQEYVRKKLGAANSRFYFGSDEKYLKDHAWYDENSNNQTHPVAELAPLVVKGSIFYDLYGNVAEWAHEYYDYGVLLGGKDPYGPEDGFLRALRGGTFEYTASMFGSSERNGWPEESRARSVGLRLVRTLK